MRNKVVMGAYKIMDILAIYAKIKNFVALWNFC